MMDYGIALVRERLEKRGIRVERVGFPADHPIDLLDILLEWERATGPDFVALQIGANDGVTGDPIHDHVVRRGWTLLAVEPVASAFRRLQGTYDGCGNVLLENCAVSRRDGTMTLYVVKNGDPGASQLASFSREVLWKHRNCIANLRDRIEEVQVPALTFDSLMKKHGVTSFDLLWVDTEGFDFEVIKMALGAGGLPRLIGFENQHLKHREMKECGRLLASHGYRWLNLGRDTIAHLKP